MKVGESEKRSLSVLCLLLGYTRQAYYGHFRECERDAAGAELVVQEVLRIRERERQIGTRKLHERLSGFMRRHGIRIGRDRFFGLLRERSLLVRRRQCKKPRTTFSCYWLKKYPNLAKGFVAWRANQLWVSDITYIRIGAGFGYLSLITDAYSRKIVGHNLSRDLSARGCVAALKMALRNNRDRDGLIHHSDRGMQYYSEQYVKLLGKTRISMSEKSHPLENPVAERVNGILKQELLHPRYDTFADARQEVDKGVSIYNNERQHMSIDMLTPAEAHRRTGQLKRRWKSYYTNQKRKPDPGLTMNRKPIGGLNP